MLDGLTLGQIEIFLMVIDEGSFSRAAKRISRAPSAVTYAIERLESQLGVTLFDRGGYRPTLTDAGRALWPRAQRVSQEIEDFRLVAKGIAGGLEAELSLAIEAVVPMALLSGPLMDFQRHFPTVQLKLSVERLNVATASVLDGRCALGLVNEYSSTDPALVTVPIFDAALVMVAAKDHPLASLTGPIPPRTLEQHVQLVLADGTSPKPSRDYSVHSGRTWRIADLGAKHAMLLDGLGFGSLPRHMAQPDVDDGRLALLNIEGGFGRELKLSLGVCRRADRPVGPAARWLLDRLVANGPVSASRPRVVR